MTLYSGPLSMFGAKVQIAALEKRLDFELVMVPYDSRRGYDPKHPEVLRINPKRQVPVLVHGALEIFDSTQIFEYLEDIQPEPALWPREPAARAVARGLELQSDEVYFPQIIRLMGLQDALDSEPAVAAIAAAGKHYVEMDRRLASSEWLAGTHSFASHAASARMAGTNDAAHSGLHGGERHGPMVERRGPARARVHGCDHRLGAPRAAARSARFHPAASTMAARHATGHIRANPEVCRAALAGARCVRARGGAGVLHAVLAGAAGHHHRGHRRDGVR
jgi:glutathione S-transferase